MRYVLFKIGDTLFFIRISNFLLRLDIRNFLTLSLGLFLIYSRIPKFITSPKNLGNMFQSLLMLYYIVKLSKSLYLHRLYKNISESSIIAMIRKILMF